MRPSSRAPSMRTTRCSKNCAVNSRIGACSTFTQDSTCSGPGIPAPQTGPDHRGDAVEFRIADTFTDSLARLTGDEQKAAKTTAFDLQINPASPGLSFHKLDRAKDKNFWSVRVSSDIRLIVHRSEASLLLCYVGH